MKTILSAAAAGVLFAIGLGVGGMTDPAKVRGFLDVSGDWNPSLAFVMAGALLTHGLLRVVILRRRTRPVFEPTFSAPAAGRVDARLLSGAALFGIGWGLSGYCPGPAFTALSNGTAAAATFVVAMLVGMQVFGIVERLFAGRGTTVSGPAAAEAETSRLSGT